MAKLHVATTAVTVSLSLAIETLQRELPAPITSLVGRITDEVQQYVDSESLGYYPAFDYLSDHKIVDTYLLDALEEVAALATQLASQKLMEQLKPVFSQMQVQSVQCLAFSMPPVRVAQNNAKSLLATHLTPNRLKFELLMSLIQRQPADEAIAGKVKNMVYRWLNESFEAVDINSARFLTD